MQYFLAEEPYTATHGSDGIESKAAVGQEITMGASLWESSTVRVLADDEES